MKKTSAALCGFISGLLLAAPATNARAGTEIVPTSYSFDYNIHGPATFPSVRYPDDGAPELTDGFKGGKPPAADLSKFVGWLNDGWTSTPGPSEDWAGNIDFVFSGGNEIGRIEVNTIQDVLGNIVIPDVAIYSSPDSSDGSWTFLQEIPTAESAANNDTRKVVSFSGLGITANHVRVTLSHTGRANTDYGPWIFCDEIDFFDPVVWTQLGARLDGEAGGDYSGRSVALSADGTRLAVGAPENDGNGADSGHVRVYELVGGAWTQLGADLDGEAAGDRSGGSVALSADGNRLAVGASSNDGNGADSGHVRVYELVGGAWVQLGVDLNGEDAGDRSGRSVALSADGSRLAVGAPYNDSNGADSGHVRVYEWTAGGWSQLGAELHGEEDRSGSLVALSADGTRLTVGAPLYDGDSPITGRVRVYRFAAGVWTKLGAYLYGESYLGQTGSNETVALSADGTRLAVGSPSFHNGGPGSVRVYELVGGAWVPLGVDLDGEDAGDESGISVALSADGTRLAVGALFNDGNSSWAGHVRVYGLIGDTWEQLGADLDGEDAGDVSGRSVALSADGNRLAVGAPFNDGNGADSGHVRVYELVGGAWTQLGADLDGEAAGDVSGVSVALSADGNRLAVGAPSNDGNGADSGHVRVYELVGGAWVPLGTDLDGEAAGDRSGISVALSADGSRLAVGASTNRGNGTNSGHVRVYGLIGDTWEQLGADLNGETAGDNSGWSVVLSADGNRLAVGALLNDGNGADSGHVRVYRLIGGTWVQLGADLDGEDADDQSGWSVALSADGTRLAVGARFNDGNGADSGHVRVYRDILAPATGPKVVPRITSLALTAGTIDLTWSDFGGGSGYAIETSTTGNSWTVHPDFADVSGTTASIPRDLQIPQLLLRVRAR